jgi:hypothetical protein
MTEIPQTGLAQTFAAELRSFFVLCLLSLVFGALALAFGLQFIATALLAMAASGDFGIFPFLQALAGWAAVVIGFRWILSSARILKGVNPIRREYRAVEGSLAGDTGKGPGPGEAMPGTIPGDTGMEPGSGRIPEHPVPGEALTGLIIRMMAHYRENWKTIMRMNLISTLGGWIFLVLGVANIAQGISAWYSGTGLSFLLPFLASGINMTIGLASLLFSSSFRRYSRAWERRLVEASHAEEGLRDSMEPG